MYPPYNIPHTPGERQMCAVSVWKLFHNQWNEIKNLHPCSQERSLKKHLAFLIMIRKKISQCLQKVLVHPYKYYVLIYTKLAMLKKCWWLTADGIQGTGQSALYIFSWILTASIDGRGNQDTERLNNLPKFAHNSEVVETKFALESVWHQSLCSELLPHSAASMPAYLNLCSSLLDQSLAVSGYSVKFGWMIIF